MDDISTVDEVATSTDSAIVEACRFLMVFLVCLCSDVELLIEESVVGVGDG
jgi:hypothetical protein